VDNAFQELLADFLLEARERLDRVEELVLALGDLAVAQRPDSLATIKRELHTLKGNSGMMGFAALQAAAHEVEDQVEALDVEAPAIAELLKGLDRFRRLLWQVSGEGTASPSAEGDVLLEEASQELALGSVRVPFSALDGMVELLTEVLLYRSRLSGCLERVRALTPLGTPEEEDAWSDLGETHQTLDKTLDFLQDRVIQLRMVPLQTLFRYLGRIVHDESARDGKQVRFETEGGGTPLDKALLELAGEALGHLVRNAVNHGIEAPAWRLEAGKKAEGTVRLEAAVRGQEVHIEVSDDGAGIDPAHLRQVAQARGEAARSDAELLELLFRPGFSTREGADLSAGRGIGLSAVAEAVRRYGGRVEIASEPGNGSRFLLRLPLSVSITRALLVKVAAETYAIPLGAILESLRHGKGRREVFGGREVIRWREELVPMEDLGTWFGLEGGLRGFAVIVEALGELKALMVDQLLEIRDIVVKGLDPLLGPLPGIGGSTILADGKVILIVDPSAFHSDALPVLVAGAGAKS
jgi:two-component system chemotaxis sensor kinase CheA